MGFDIGMDLDLYDLSDWADAERFRLSEAALSIGLGELSATLLEANDPEGLYDSAQADLQLMTHEDVLHAAIPAGVIVGEVLNVIRDVARAALAQDVPDEN